MCLYLLISYLIRPKRLLLLFWPFSQWQCKKISAKNTSFYFHYFLNLPIKCLFFLTFIFNIIKSWYISKFWWSIFYIKKWRIYFSSIKYLLYNSLAFSKMDPCSDGIRRGCEFCDWGSIPSECQIPRDYDLGK